MDTVKSNPDNFDAEKANIINQKKQRLQNLKEFLNLKVKIHQLINLKRIEEAKEAYHNLYIIYERIIQNADERESIKLQADISTIYSKIISAVNKKTVKKANEKPKIVSEEKVINRKTETKKIITTDLDIIIKIVEDKGRMSLSEIQSTFNINRKLAEEWIQLLADYGLVEIRYLPVGGIEITKIQKIKHG
ncbi:MAG: hypothetical protein ACMXYG_00405 [Candidatus Woesearchaeota archaeon]